MLPVKDWFGEFFIRHSERYPREDWPLDDLRGEFWQNWRVNLVERNVTEAEAEAASHALAREGVKYLDGHLGTLLRLIQLRRESLRPSETSYAGAMALSRDCPDCLGQVPAVATRWPHDRTNRYYGAAVTFRCSCPLGRFLDEADRNGPPASRQGMPRLADFPELMRAAVDWSETPDNRYCYPPDQWDEAAGRPVEAPAYDRAHAVAREARRRAPVQPVDHSSPAYKRAMADLGRKHHNPLVDQLRVQQPDAHKTGTDG